MAKKLIRSIKVSDLLSCGSGIKQELMKPEYGFYASYDASTKTFYIVGKNLIAMFVKNMLQVIDSLRVDFKDATSIAEFDNDVTFLQSMLK